MNIDNLPLAHRTPDPTSTSTRHQLSSPGMRHDLVLLFAIALIIRLVAAGLLGMWVDPFHLTGRLVAEELLLAQSLVDGRGYVTPYANPDGAVYTPHPSAHSPPGYPFTLAGIIALSDRLTPDRTWAFRAAVLLSNLAGAAAVVLLAACAGAEGPGGARGRRAGSWFAGLLAACWPLLVIESCRLWDTAFVFLAIALALWIAVYKPPSTSRRAGASLGLAYGLLMLFNPAILPVQIASVAIRLFRLHNFAQARQYGLGLALAWVVCLTPWTLRNAAEFHRFIPVRNNLGLELSIGNRDDADGTSLKAITRHPFLYAPERRLVSELGDDRYMQAKQAEAIHWIHHHPTEFLRLTGKRIVLFWSGNISAREQIFGHQIPTLFGMALGRLCLGLFLPLAAWFGCRPWDSAAGKWLVALGVLILPLPYYITHVAGNYRVIVVPLLCVPAGLFLASLWTVLATRWSPRHAQNFCKQTIENS